MIMFSPLFREGHGAAAAAAAASKGEEDRPIEDRPEGPPKSETSDKPEINLADFPTQFGKPAKKRTDKSYFHEGIQMKNCTNTCNIYTKIK